MIIDTSALLGIILKEPEARQLANTMQSAPVLRLSAASYVEAALYVDRHGDALQRASLDTFLREFDIQIEPITAEQALLARQGFNLFGKGKHKAALNFGDCFTYALAKAYREPLLFKGNDFSLTDLEAA